jgi:hypothetical protein
MLFRIIQELIWADFDKIIGMKRLLFLAPIFLLLLGCSNKTEEVDSENHDFDSLNIIKIRDAEYEYENIENIIDRYRDVQKGYELLDSAISALDTANITEDDINYILSVSYILRVNQALLFAEQYKIRALYCSKVLEALDKCKAKEKKPEYYEFFCADMDTLTEKENMGYFKLAADYLYIEDGDNKMLDSSRDISSFVQ